MIGTGNGHWAFKYKAGLLAMLVVTMGALAAGNVIAAPAVADASSVQVTPEVRQLLQNADKALNAGNLNLALIHIKNAVRLAPEDGDVRVRLGVMILQSGEAAAAERELRQALSDNAAAELVLPP